MTLRSGTFVFLVAVVALTLLDCGGRSPNVDGPTHTTQTPGRLTDTPTSEQGTPLSPKETVSKFADQLDAIGVSAGSIPGDVQKQILIDCGRLVDYSDRETIAQLCNAIAQAMKNHDPGLLDLVVNELRKLEVD